MESIVRGGGGVSWCLKHARLCPFWAHNLKKSTRNQGRLSSTCPPQHCCAFSFLASLIPLLGALSRLSPGAWVPPGKCFFGASHSLRDPSPTDTIVLYNSHREGLCFDSRKETKLGTLQQLPVFPPTPAPFSILMGRLKQIAFSSLYRNVESLAGSRRKE